MVVTKSLKERFVSLEGQRESLEGQAKSLGAIIDGLEKEARFLQVEKATLEDTWNMLRSLLDKFSAESIGKLKDLLNKGLQVIFTDRDYEIKITISDTKRKQLKMYLVEHTDEGDMETELNGALMLFGGGVLMVISFIFRVFLIVLYEKRRFVLVDEGWTNLSGSYIENFFKFLQYLHKDMGFDFFIVNHDPRFAAYMDRTYEVVMGDVRLKEDRRTKDE